MKTFKLFTSIALVVVLITAVGCKKDPVAPPPPTPETTDETIPAALVATWVFTSASVNGQSADLADVLGWGYSSAYAAFRIWEDGDVLYVEFDSNIEVVASSTGNISTTGNKFSLKITDDYGDTISLSGTWSVQGTLLTLNTKVDGESARLSAELAPEE